MPAFKEILYIYTRRDRMYFSVSVSVYKMFLFEMLHSECHRGMLAIIDKTHTSLSSGIWRKWLTQPMLLWTYLTQISSQMKQPTCIRPSKT